MFTALIEHCEKAIDVELKDYVRIEVTKNLGTLFTITVVDKESRGARFFNSRMAQWCIHDTEPNVIEYLCGNVKALGLKKPICRKNDDLNKLVNPIIKFLNTNKHIFIAAIDNAGY
ncbi:MAG: hypothetical protein ACRC3J_05155 [Culicoidibacterales bacterium]